MIPTLLDLLPEELETIPVWDAPTSTNNNNTGPDRRLLAGGNCAGTPITGDDRPGSRCCLGAISKGGDQRYAGAETSCGQDRAVYQRVRDLALSELGAHPARARHGGDAAATGCDVCRIVRVLASMEHRRFAFLGDSVQSQAFTALECELRRRGFDVRAGPTREWPAPGGGTGWRYGIKREVCITVAVPGGVRRTADHPDDDDDDESVGFCFYKHYRPIEDMVQHKAIADTHDVLMINYGLHFLPTKREREGLERSLEALLRAVVVGNSGGGKGARVLYRETSAQHFDNEGGEYQKRKRKRAKSKTCKPVSATDALARWRTDVFRGAANRTGVSVVDALRRRRDGDGDYDDNNNQPEVAFLPFWDFTAELHDLHNGEDCTHYCYSPHTFYPLWRHIRIALDGVVDEDGGGGETGRR